MDLKEKKIKALFWPFENNVLELEAKEGEPVHCCRARRFRYVPHDSQKRGSGTADLLSPDV